jgi:hypothetical protein
MLHKMEWQSIRKSKMHRWCQCSVDKYAWSLLTLAGQRRKETFQMLINPRITYNTHTRSIQQVNFQIIELGKKVRWNGSPSNHMQTQNWRECCTWQLLTIGSYWNVILQWSTTKVTINAPSTFQKPAINGNNKYIKLQGIQRWLIILHPLT